MVTRKSELVTRVTALAIVLGLAVVFGAGLVLAAEVEEEGPMQLFVSPTGDDRNPGTLEAPFRTLERARDEIRAIVARDGALPNGGVTVSLRGGEYLIERTFTLTKADSGTSDRPVVYRSYDGEVARLHGSERLDPAWFKPVDDPEALARLPDGARSAVLYVDLAEHGIEPFEPLIPYGFGISEYRPGPDLLIDGAILTLARWPNEGFAEIARVVDAGSLRGDAGPPRGGVIQPGGEGIGERLARWANAPDLWIHGYYYWDWAEQVLDVAEVDPEAGTLRTGTPSPYGFREGQRYYVFNLLEELDAPGEWYLDRARGLLFVYPPSSPEGLDIRLTRLLEPLFSVQDASHITFENLVFERARGTGLEIRGGSNVRVLASTFRQLANKGILIDGGRHHEVLESDFLELGSGGIEADGGDLRTLSGAGHRIENNSFYDVARIRRTYGPAVRISGVGITVAHNRIDNLPHAAIIFSGNEHLIEYNHISNVAYETFDVGMVYAGRSWTGRGNVVRYNFFDGSPNGEAVYLDDAFSGTHVYGNVARSVFRGTQVGGGRDNVYENNVIISTTRPIRADARCLTWFASLCEPGGYLQQQLFNVPYHSEPWASRYPQLLTLLGDEPAMPKYNVFRNNIVVASGRIEIDPEVQSYGTVENNLVLQSGARVNDEAWRLEIDPDVLAQVPGFEPIPFERIGMRRGVRIESPQAGAVLMRAVPLRLEATAGEALEWVDISLDGEVIYAGGELPRDLLVGGSGLGEGDHLLEVVARFAGGRSAIARTSFSQVHAAFKTLLEDTTRVRGDLDIDVDAAFPEEELAWVAIHLERIERGAAVERRPLYEGRTLPAPFTFDTVLVPDGDYRLSLDVRAATGAEAADAFIFAIDNWNVLEDRIDPPVESPIFGFFDRKRTVAASDGWAHQVGTAGLFFGDSGRIARKADTTEFLVWEVADFRRFEFTLYAKSEAIGDTVRVEYSADQSAWKAAAYDARVSARNDEWSMIVVSGEVEPGNRFLRLTFREGGLPADAVQLGAAAIYSLQKRD